MIHTVSSLFPPIPKVPLGKTLNARLYLVSLGLFRFTLWVRFDGKIKISLVDGCIDMTSTFNSLYPSKSKKTVFHKLTWLALLWKLISAVSTDCK